MPPGLKIASDWSPWATQNRPGRLEIMIQEPIGELRIGLSATAVDPIPCESDSRESNLCRGDYNLADTDYPRVQLLSASFVILIYINY